MEIKQTVKAKSVDYSKINCGVVFGIREQTSGLYTFCMKLDQRRGDCRDGSPNDDGAVNLNTGIIVSKEYLLTQQLYIPKSILNIDTSNLP